MAAPETMMHPETGAILRRRKRDETITFMDQMRVVQVEGSRNLLVPDQLSRLSPHRPTSPFPNHAAPQHDQNHIRSKC
jgi:hypothetical protein